MNFIYYISLRFYLAIALIISPFKKKAKLFYYGRRGLLDKIASEIDQSADIIWIHCASVGEFEQARPLIERFKECRADHKILLTFFSPSGYELRKNYPLADWVYYLPMDTPKNATRFVELVNPKLVIFIKYEFWFNYLYQLKIRRISTYIVSAIFREDQVFFRWYGGFFRRMLRTYNLLFVQDSNSEDLLRSIGIKNIIVSGDTRFDRVVGIISNGKDIPAIQCFIDGRKSFIAGSTWGDDEEMILSVLPDRLEFKLVIVPHEVSTRNSSRLLSLFSKYKTVLYSDIDSCEEFSGSNLASYDVLIVDTIGLLSRLYRYASVAYIGGGFGAGIHNILEPAVYGIPIIFGPQYRKFREAHDLIAMGGAFSFSKQEQLRQFIYNVMLDEPCRKISGDISRSYVNSNLGATNKIIEAIESANYHPLPASTSSSATKTSSAESAKSSKATTGTSS